MLPDLIEIVPLSVPVQAEVTVPGSKSITNRALVLAALAEGTTVLQGALWSEDTQVMVECLHALGFEVKVEADPEEFCNRTITVQGQGGRIPKAGTVEKPLELFVGNAGTAARFLAATVCLGNGVYRLHGVSRMHERPQAALFQALRQLGYRIDSPNDKLPAVIHGTGPKSGAKCEVSVEESSQFLSALALCAAVGYWDVKTKGNPDIDELPYVVMTHTLVTKFAGQKVGNYSIEPDCSSGSYFWAAGWVQDPHVRRTKVKHWPPVHWPHDAGDWQIDAQFPFFLDPNLRPVISRKNELGDSIMTAIILAPFTNGQPIKFTDLGRLRVQECERVVALRTELTKCGAKVIEEGDTLTVHPSQLHGAEIETYNDHRMAMCFAVVGLKVPGVKLRNPACVKKTFPNFFQKLATPPPHGLGVTILDGHSGRKLGMDELFAD